MYSVLTISGAIIANVTRDMKATAIFATILMSVIRLGLLAMDVI